jgi:hypothetical protein
MKIIKLKKSDYFSLQTLLARAGAVNGRNAYPSHVYVSPKTYKQINKSITQMFKEESYLKGVRLKASVGMYMLNLAPNTLKGLADGVMLVDERAIEKEKTNVIENGI